ncbi:MAG: nuclear transport factor 2 family protein [Candidatus Limnocylindrales bacterium]
MGEADNRRTVERFIAGINAKDVESFKDLFTDDSVIAYPQSGEIIRGRANRSAVYAATPGLPTVTPYRTTSSGDIVVVEADLDYGNDQFQTVFIFEFRDGRIAFQTTYWSKPFPAAEWRSRWVEKA